jgi:hypothetical protein
MKPIAEASTFLSAANCFHSLSKSEDEQKEFRAQAMAILRAITSHTFSTTK